MAPRLRMRFAVIAILLLDLAIAIAAATFWQIHRSPSLFLAVGIALAAGTAIGLAGALRRWPAWAVGGLTIAAYILLGVPAAVPGAAAYGVLPTVRGLGDLIVGSALSWKELLTISLPVGSYQALLIPAFLSTLVVTVVAVSVGLRARFGELAAIAPVVLFVVGILFGPTTTTWPLATSLALLVVLLSYLIWFRARRHAAALAHLAAQTGTRLEHPGDRRSAGVRSAAGAAVILLLAGSGAVAAQQLVPVSGERAVLRSSIEIPFDPSDYASPLSAFRRYFQGDLATSTMLTVSGLEPGERLRIATLDDYDGVVYSVGGAAAPSASGTFARVPYELDPTGGGRQANLSVTVGDYSGVWVPDSGSLETIDFGGSRGPVLQNSFYYNAASGTGAVVAELERGDSYELDALIPDQLDDDQLGQLQPGSAPLPDLAELPDGLADTLTEYVGGADTPGEQLVAMISGLKANGYVSHGVGDQPFSRSGHSADRISELLEAQPMLGDAEQYAVTAALMARALGFPARVVMGFVAPETSDADGAAITGADLSAWIEVNAAGVGWVEVDPNPVEREIPPAQADDPTEISRPQSVVQPPVEERAPTDDPAPPDVTQSDQPAPEPVWLTVLLAAARIIGVIAAVLAVLVAPFLGIIAAKWRRRRARRDAVDPALRVAGGWDEFADTAVDLGVDPAPHATRRELAGAVGGVAPLRLAFAVDRVTFSPETATADEADQVWATVGELRESLGEGRTRWERLRAAISLRSFVARREAGPLELVQRRLDERASGATADEHRPSVLATPADSRFAPRPASELPDGAVADGAEGPMASGTTGETTAVVGPDDRPSGDAVPDDAPVALPSVDAPSLPVSGPSEDDHTVALRESQPEVGSEPQPEPEVEPDADADAGADRDVLLASEPAASVQPTAEATPQVEREDT